MSVIIVPSLCCGVLCQTAGGVFRVKQLVMDALARRNRIGRFELTVQVRDSTLKTNLGEQLRQ
jgi:hypothetical protein